MFKYTKTTLQKIETIFDEMEYKVRYEKGSFQSGYCLVENKKIAVVNRFFDIEGRINVLLEILSSFEGLDESLFTEKTLAFYHKIMKFNTKVEAGKEAVGESENESVEKKAESESVENKAEDEV